MTARIPGGYYIKARQARDSEIAHAPPVVREVWDYLLSQAMFRDGRHLKRGEVLTSFREMSDALSWRIGWRREQYSKCNIETAMNWLRKRAMIQTRRTTRGFIITVCKYEFYQTPSNYETDSETDTEPTRNRPTPATVEKKGRIQELEPSVVGGDEAHRILKACEALRGITWEQDRTVRQSFMATPRPLDWSAVARYAVSEAALLGEPIKHPAMWWRRRVEQYASEHFGQKAPARSGGSDDSLERLTAAFIQ